MRLPRLPRTRAGQRPWHPDAMHLHHRMLRIGHGHRRAVLLLYLWAAIVALGSVSIRLFDPRRIAILLLGGDKTNQWESWYARMIPAADQLYDDHLAALRREGELP